MDFLKRLTDDPVFVFKAIGVIVVGIFLFSFLASTIGPTIRSTTQGIADYGVSESSMPYGGGIGYDSDGGYAVGAPTISARNIAPIYPRPGNSVGGDAEEYEARDYTVQYESRNRDAECEAILAFKTLSYVIFENASEGDTSCTYTFKVELQRVDEILSQLKNLGPKDLYENTYTIKSQLDDFTSREEILKAKLAVMNETLSSALAAYDDITELATRSQNVDALAKIIDSRLQTIERLTQERLNISAELEYLSRAKAEQLDLLEYSRFYVSVYEEKYVDTDALRDSWRAAIQKFVRDVNQALQNATVNLIALLITLIPYLIFLALLLVGAKYGWRFVRNVWNSETRI